MLSCSGPIAVMSETEAPWQKGDAEGLNMPNTSMAPYVRFSDAPEGTGDQVVELTNETIWLVMSKKKYRRRMCRPRTRLANGPFAFFALAS